MCCAHFAHTRTLFSEPTADHAPQFTSQLENTKAKEGADVKFACAVDGEPTPEVTWLINGQQVAPSDGVVMVMENGQAMLTLKGVTADKAGEVTCKVKHFGQSLFSCQGLHLKNHRRLNRVN